MASVVVTETYRRQNWQGLVTDQKEGLREGSHDDKEVREQEDLDFNSQMVTLFQAMLSLP